MGVGALALLCTFPLKGEMFRAKTKLTLRLTGQMALSGLVGMSLGMTFLLYALANGPAGIVCTLSAMSPVLILPILWGLTGERPAAGAWGGAVLAVAGAGFIFNA